MNKIYLYGWEGIRAYHKFKELEKELQLSKTGEKNGFYIYEDAGGFTRVHVEYCLMDYS